MSTIYQFVLALSVLTVFSLDTVFAQQPGPPAPPTFDQTVQPQGVIQLPNGGGQSLPSGTTLTIPGVTTPRQIQVRVPDQQYQITPVQPRPQVVQVQPQVVQPVLVPVRRMTPCDPRFWSQRRPVRWYPVRSGLFGTGRVSGYWAFYPDI